MSTNGIATDPTGGVPTAVNNTFRAVGNGVPSDAASDPSVLASENLAGTYRVTDSSTASMLTDSYASSGTNPAGSFPYSFSGSTTATAQYGLLKSGSQATISGNSFRGNTYNGAESYATVLDTLTPSSGSVANGTSGTMKIAFSIDGSMSLVANNFSSDVGECNAGIDFRYNSTMDGSMPSLANSAPALIESDASIYGNGSNFYVHSSYGFFTSPPGMSETVGPTSSSGSPSYLTFGGSTIVYATIPIVFGSATTFDVGMLTYVDPEQDSTVSSLFDDTATLTGIQVFDSNGNSVNDFTIASASGTQYGANGVNLGGSASAPEPGALALLLPGVGVVGMAFRRRRQRASVSVPLA